MSEALNTATPTREEVDARVEIDRSCRAPVLFFYASGLFWLLLSCVLGLLLSWKLNHPTFLADCSFLSYGRLVPAYWGAVLFGFASQLGIGTAIWLMARFSRTPLCAPWITLIAGKFWNVGTTVGIVAVLLGDGTSMPWLDFPGYAVVILMVSFALLSVWTLMMFRERKTTFVFVSQWYLVASFFWFPWIYLGANLMILALPLKGVMLELVNAWFVQGMIWFWFTPIALATIYYLIPKITGRAIYLYQMAPFGFWTLALLAGLTGPTLLIGGPIPVWLQAVGSVASILLLIPVMSIATNFVPTFLPVFDKTMFSPSLRFAVAGTFAFVLASITNALFSVRIFSQYAQFSSATPGLQGLFVFGFFALVMFGAIYFIVPRVIGCEWCSTTLISMHFWLTIYGLAGLLAAQIFGGLAHGTGLQNPDVTFEQVTSLLTPYVALQTLAGLVVLFAQFLFVCHFLLMVLQLIRSDRDPVRMTQPKATVHTLEAAQV